MFSYELPESNKFLKNCIEYLNLKDQQELATLLLNSVVHFVITGQFSHRQWDEYQIIACLSVPKIIFKKFDEETLNILKDTFNSVLPKNSGYFISSIELSLKFDDEITLEDDLLTKIQGTIKNQLLYLPSDLIEKGREMAEWYVYFYAIENSLRLFIEKVAKNKYGDNYMDHLTLTRGVQNKIETRKKQEGNHLWVPLRGGTDLYYTDFVELGLIIQSNWEIFKDHFPNLEFIKTKIEELNVLRNMVAHFSYLNDAEKQIVIAYYSIIIAQINRRNP